MKNTLKNKSNKNEKYIETTSCDCVWLCGSLDYRMDL